MKIWLTLTVALAAALPMAARNEADKRLEAADVTLKEMFDTKDKGIPQELLDRSECVVIVPGMKKGGFILAGKFGRGFMSCRNSNGAGWTAPGGVRIEGGSIGLQVGGSETDVILLVMNQSGAQRLLKSQFTLGGDASVAAGPVGRSSEAQTDVTMRAEILSYSRSRGVFAGVALNGSTLRQDLDANEELYGKKVTNEDVVKTGTAAPAGAKGLLATLNKYSARQSKGGSGAATPKAKTTK